jgi:hypothetical protein
MTDENPMQSEEIEQASLDVLIARHPKDLTDADYVRIVEELRANRHVWYQEEAEAQAQGRRARPAKGTKSRISKKAAKALEGIDLDALDMEGVV